MTSPRIQALDEPGQRAAAGPAQPIDDLLDNPNLPGFTVSDLGAPTPQVVAPRLDGRGDHGGDRGRGRGRRRGRERGRNGRSAGREGGGGSGGGGGGGSNGGGGGGERSGREAGGGRGGRNGGAPGRLSKSTPIRDVVKEGQEIIVQVTKEPIGTKGARCSSHISLPGRYVVYLPTVEHVGVSASASARDKERARLRETIESMKPPTGGLIVRTVAEGLTKKQLKQDVGYLVRLWGEVAKKREGAQRPAEPPRASSTSSSRRRAISSPTTSTRSSSTTRRSTTGCRRFVEMFMPERLKDVVYYSERRAHLRRLRHRGRDRPRAVAQGAAAPRRLPHHRPGRGAHRHRREHRSLRRQGLARTWRRPSSRPTSRRCRRSPTSSASATSAASSSSTSSTWRSRRTARRCGATLEELLAEGQGEDDAEPHLAISASSR